MKTENTEDIIDLLGLKTDKSTVHLLRKFKVRKNGEGYILIAPNEEFKEWAERVLLRSVRNRVFVKVVTAHKGGASYLPESGLCGKLTFENYIVGRSNKAVYEIALKVADGEIDTFNPLIIYGRVGVGKTHILHAIGNRRVEIGSRVIYKSINDFSEEVVKYAMGGRISSLREKYKEVDVLLIDDIQFLAGKERTQVELFTIFNSFLMMGKQIVLTSDRHPKNLIDVSDRLINRFSAGLIVELDIDRETKETIIRKKLEEYDIKVDDRIVNYIVDSTGNSVREIEGAIKKIKVFGMDAIIGEVIESEREGFSFNYIKKIVANYYGVNPEELCKGSRRRRIAEARHVCMYLSKKLLEKVSLVQIGRAFGVKDHTTVIHAINKVEEKRRKDRKFGYFLSTIENHLKKRN